MGAKGLVAFSVSREHLAVSIDVCRGMPLWSGCPLLLCCWCLQFWLGTQRGMSSPSLLRQNEKVCSLWAEKT